MSSVKLQCDEQSVEKKFKVVFVLGPPGSGKGTICQIISPRYSFVHLSAGDLLRKEMSRPDSHLASQIRKHIQEGSIVPVEITCRLISNAMEKTESFTGTNCFLVDGFPRNENNRDGWELYMKHTEVCAVVVVECSDEECIRRCMGRGGGRVDDKEEVLKNRLIQHREQCIPIIEYYEKQGLVVHINGEQSREDVNDEVIRKLDPIMYPCLLGEAPEDVILLGDVKEEEEQAGEEQKGGEESQPTEELQEQILSYQNRQSEEQASPVLQQDIPPDTQEVRKSSSKSSKELQERRSSSHQQQEVEQLRSSSEDQKPEGQFPLGQQDIPPDTQEVRKSSSKSSKELQERRSSSHQQQEVEQGRLSSQDQKSEEEHSQSAVQQLQEIQQTQPDYQE
ncbi:hypothetical protein Aperf_G00000046436 [Anoplocephala perfoliata]